MGLQLAYEDLHGGTHSSAYWRITHYDVNVAAQMITVFTSVYADKASRDAGKEPYFKLIQEIRDSDYATVLAAMETSGAREALYDHIKTTDEFDGAVDVDPDA